MLISPSFLLQVGSSEATLIIIVLAVAVGIVVVVYLWWIEAVIFKKPLTGTESLIGKKGVAKTDLRPASFQDNEGEVTIDGIVWRATLAESEGNSVLAKGCPIVVVGVSALRLVVKSA